MIIEWNKVTWYSKLAAVIVGLAVYAVGFYTGMQYQAVKAAKDSADSAGVAIQGANSISGATTANPVVLNTVHYSCDGGRSIDAQFLGDGNPADRGQVALTLSDGRSMTLPQTISADGARYATSSAATNGQDAFVFWTKGNGAFIEESPIDSASGDLVMTYTNCVAQSGQNVQDAQGTQK